MRRSKYPVWGPAPRDLSRQSLAEVVEPRYDELFTLIQSELRRSGYEELIPAGVVLTGGTSKMEGAVELAEEIFHMPVRVGAPQYARVARHYPQSDLRDCHWSALVRRRGVY